MLYYLLPSINITNRHNTEPTNYVSIAFFEMKLSILWIMNRYFPSEISFSPQSAPKAIPKMVKKKLFNILHRYNQVDSNAQKKINLHNPFQSEWRWEITLTLVTTPSVIDICGLVSCAAPVTIPNSGITDYWWTLDYTSTSLNVRSWTGAEQNQDF